MKKILLKIKKEIMNTIQKKNKEKIELNKTSPKYLAAWTDNSPELNNFHLDLFFSFSATIVLFFHLHGYLKQDS